MLAQGSEAGLLPMPCPGGSAGRRLPGFPRPRLAPTGICVTQRAHPEVGLRE